MNASISLVGRMTARSDAGEQQVKLFDGDLTTGVTRQLRLLGIILPKSTTDQEIVFSGIVTGRALVVTTDRPVSIRLNAADASPIVVNGVFVLIGTFTALYLTNADTAHAATLDILIAGA